MTLSSGRIVQRFVRGASSTKCNATRAMNVARMNSQVAGSVHARPSPAAVHHAPFIVAINHAVTRRTTISTLNMGRKRELIKGIRNSSWSRPGTEGRAHVVEHCAADGEQPQRI